MKFGYLLKKYREQNGLKRKDIAEILDKSAPYASNIENGTKEPPAYQHINTLIKYLKIPRANQLEFYRAAFIERASDDDKKFIEKINELAKEHLRSDAYVFLESPEAEKELETLIRERFSILFNDDRAAELLSNPHVLDVLEELGTLSQDRWSEAAKMIQTILKGLK